MSEYILNKDYFIKVIEDLAVLAEEKKDYFFLNSKNEMKNSKLFFIIV